MRHFFRNFLFSLNIDWKERFLLLFSRDGSAQSTHYPIEILYFLIRPEEIGETDCNARSLLPFSLFLLFPSTPMARPIPLTHPQDPNILPVTGRVTRATSNLQKQVLLTSEDQEMEDEIVLAPLPSAHSQSQDQLLSSQTRDQTEGNAREDHVEEEMEEEEEREPTPEHCKDWPRDEDGNYTVPDPGFGNFYLENQAEVEEEVEEEEEEEEEDYNSDVSAGEYGAKDPIEMRQIEDEMEQLEQNVPQIVDKYKLVDRLGEGTSLTFIRVSFTHAE